MKFIKSTNSNQSGQVAIVILLIMVVLLTVGLSLASRTTQEVFLSQQEADSARVFNAAESGIESALSQNFSGAVPSSVPDAGIDNVTTDTTITSQQGTLETQITEGSTAYLDLTSVAPGSTINVKWSKKSNCDAASLIATTYYEEGGVIKAVHEVFGPDVSLSGCANSRESDGFIEKTADISALPYLYKHAITLPSTAGITLKSMRIKAVYNDAPIQVTGAGTSTQLYVIRSAASNNSGNESRTIEVKRGLSAAPSFMDYAVYSGGALTQN